MALFGKGLSRITEQDLLDLLSNKEPEGKTLDYKEVAVGRGDTDKKEFLYDISSLANSEGGHLLFGMREAAGVPEALRGLENLNVDQEILRLEQVARDGIRPPIVGLETVGVHLSCGNTAIVMRVPKSWNPPHQVTFQKAFKFYGRASNGKYEMDVDELRSIFAVSGRIADQLREFQRSRVSKVIGGAAPVRLLDGGILILHVLPFSAFTPGATFPIQKAAQDRDAFPTLFRQDVRRLQVTFDGLLCTSNAIAPPEPQGAYTLIFRTGAVEGVASSIARGKENDWIAFPTLEAVVVKYTTIYMKTLHAFGIEPPIAVMASLLNADGKHLLHDYTPQGALWQDMPAVKLDRSRYDFAEAVFGTIPQNNNETAREMRGMLDHMANAAGLPESPFFGPDGNYLQVIN